MSIVRNLGILNIVLLIPILSDQYNTGPFEVSRTSNPTTRIGTLKKHNKKPAMTRSKKRFIFYSLNSRKKAQKTQNLNHFLATLARFCFG